MFKNIFLRVNVNTFLIHKDIVKKVKISAIRGYFLFFHVSFYMKDATVSECEKIIINKNKIVIMFFHVSIFFASRSFERPF